MTAHPSASRTTESVSYANFFNSDFPTITRKRTLLSGQVVVAGTVLGRITTGGKFVKSLSASADGSEVPREIIAHDADASTGDIEVITYLAGDFDSTKLTFGTGHTAASTRDGLRVLGIFIT